MMKTIVNSKTLVRGGNGADISYAIVATPLGRLIAARTQRGICFCALGDSDRVLIGELRHDYPKAKFHRGAAETAEFAGAIANYLGGRTAMPDLPLDIRGTPFQLMVWNELRAIPAGQSRSYTEIARRIGRPLAIRAVGTANGANPVSILIPCHRALRASGHLGGYRWGLERKRRLLELEARR
jgi:AraC family transcriptional regulator of adaptative response/methylated-DNA-[protein]-cysteine methyltransferase